MYKLDQVIKEFKKISKEFPAEHPARNYYEIIIAFMLIEHKHQEIVLACNKPIYHHFQYSLPQRGDDYFLFLYSPYNPVRFSIETFDSIESVRQDIKDFYEKRSNESMKKSRRK